MSRDHYKGVPKKRAALLNSDGELEALEKGGDVNRVVGIATLAAGTVTVTDPRFKTDSFCLVSPKHPYPTASGISWDMDDGELTIRGASDSTFTIAYEVILL